MFNNALPGCIVTYMQIHGRIRIIALIIRLPIYCIVSMTSSFHDPDVSTAIVANMRVEVMAVYSVHLSSEALFAAASAIIDVFLDDFGERVRKSYITASALVRGHEISVALSDYFSYVLVKPDGSFGDTNTFDCAYTEKTLTCSHTCD